VRLRWIKDVRLLCALEAREATIAKLAVRTPWHCQECLYPRPRTAWLNICHRSPAQPRKLSRPSFSVPAAQVCSAVHKPHIKSRHFEPATVFSKYSSSHRLGSVESAAARFTQDINFLQIFHRKSRRTVRITRPPWPTSRAKCRT
jgi:hypothetical protein